MVGLYRIREYTYSFSLGRSVDCRVRIKVNGFSDRTCELSKDISFLKDRSQKSFRSWEKHLTIGTLAALILCTTRGIRTHQKAIFTTDGVKGTDEAKSSVSLISAC